MIPPPPNWHMDTETHTTAWEGGKLLFFCGLGTSLARQCWVLQAGCTSVQSQWVPAKPSTNSFSSVPVSACASWQWTWAVPVGTPSPPTHTLAIHPPPSTWYVLPAANLEPPWQWLVESWWCLESPVTERSLHLDWPKPTVPAPGPQHDGLEFLLVFFEEWTKQITRQFWSCNFVKIENRPIIY